MALFTMAIVNCITLVTDVAYSPDEINQQQRNLKLKAFEDINKALASKTETHNFNFTGKFSSPFCPLSSKGVKHRKTGKVVKTVYKKLFLKGTLIKEGALAIIEDEDGKTFICRQGEKVHNRLIVNVGEDEVTIKDSNGTTVLEVRN